ncbi:MAG TPA: M1 family metallopeptidase [Rhodanobacteraceae bacterium]|nr:M1 family metallopeptidase [Rhodanobacteraceae bacterium]
MNVRSCWILGLALGAVALNAVAGQYDPRQTFALFDYPQATNRYRASDGVPGPDFWQNRADYTIHATLDAVNKTLTGSEVIHYTNQSPQPLHYLWLHLDQNRYRQDARGNFTSGANPPAAMHTAGYDLRQVALLVDGKVQPLDYTVSDTRMRVELPVALAGQGGTLALRIDYAFHIPDQFGGRTDWYPTKNGDVFEIAQWYPRMAVFDDIRGWDTLPYLNNEFYLEYGDFDYSITVPEDMIVVGSGELANPDEVLSHTERTRLDAARRSDKTVLIRTPAEVLHVAKQPVATGTRTWRFTMHNTRDVAFGASRAYIWDAARINLPQGKQALAMSAYPVESLKDGGWDRSTEFVKASVEEFSRWYPYPWPVAIAEAGIAGGMEYPGIVFDWWKTGGMGLFGLTAHEVGHNWYPMIVGSNERRDAWMDEGFNTFIDVLIADRFNHGEFGPKRDSEYAPKGGNPVDEILPLLADPEAPAIMSQPDTISEKYRHPVTYFKAALGLVLLREQILGPKLFDQAFTEYTHAWAFKHPAPSDFFRAMDNAAGEDLGWFWRGWFEHNWQLDLAVTGIKQVGETPAPKGRRFGPPDNRARVTIANLDQLVLPATLEVHFADGKSERIRLPAETWQQHKDFAVAIDRDVRVTGATIDPDHVLPDRHRGNNVYAVK